MSDHESALFTAIEAGDVVAVEQLVVADASLLVPPEPRDEDRITPLQAAACAGHLPIVKALIDHGAPIYETAQWGYPAVVHADWKGQAEVVAWFLGGGAAHPSVQGDPTYGLGVDINLAARQGWTEIVQRHLDRDPGQTERRGVIGDVPLHWASHNGHLPIIDALLAAGADVEADEIGLYGGKPLHWASEHEPAAVERLLAHGAEVDSRNLMDNDFAGFTPLLMCASQRNDCEPVARLLLAAGADPAAVDAKGRTALDIASGHGQKRVEAVLREAMAA